MRKHIISLVFLLFVILINAQEKSKLFSLSGNDISLKYVSDEIKIAIKVDKKNEGLEIATITITSEKPFSPDELSLKWATPSSNVAGYWSSQSYLDKTITPDWGPASVKSMLSRESPVICLFGHDNINRQTFAVSEALNTVITSTSVKEEDGMLYNEVKLFTEKNKKISSYQVQIRLDTRPIPYYKTLKQVSNWWETFDLLMPSKVPEAAKLPVYSTWYSYHQNINKDSLIKECKLAKKLGYKTIIVDDGWQTLDSNRGYAYTGDWKPERIPEMKEFVKEVHNLDMKFILWYAVPFVGEKSMAYEQMKGKFLDYWEGQGTYVLDPRFPEVRDFIINTYVKAATEWDLDGFKLDFLGRFKAGKKTRLVADEGRDYASVNEATDRLMTDLMSSLKEIKPDIMIEFRQPYTGPAMRKYGNMFRASDCPNIALVNRVETTDLRLLSGDTAVHADMLMWHYSEATEIAALQFLNVIFSVPQISVRLEDIPEEHFNMIQFYTDYWLQNRAILLEAEFLPSSPQLNYPIISGKSSKKQITSVYGTSNVIIDYKTPVELDILNAKMSKEVVIISKNRSANYTYEIKNCLGKTVKKGKIKIDKGANLFEIPVSGLLSLVKIN